MFYQPAYIRVKNAQYMVKGIYDGQAYQFAISITASCIISWLIMISCMIFFKRIFNEFV